MEIKTAFAAACLCALLAATTAGTAEPALHSRAPTEKEIALGRRLDRLLARPAAKTLKSAALKSRAAGVLTAMNVSVARRFPASGHVEILQVGNGDLDGTLAKLRASGAYDYVEYDPVITLEAQPDDPSFLNGDLWGLHNTGQNGGVADADIDAPEAWDIRSTATGVVVAVIDTGVFYTHEDIATNMWVNPGESGGGRETNGVDDDGNGWVDDVHGIDTVNTDGDPLDDNGHGSHCSGTIAGVGGNGVGVAGVAWSAQIMACKFLSADGSGAASDAITCIDYARSKGAHILSNSWGGGGYSQALRDAIAAAGAAGIVFAAAGNDAQDNDTSKSYPASYEEENVIAVAATTRTDGLASFSNYGVGYVEIAAPGAEILSLGIASNSSYATMSGTSMATPHVSGALALLRAEFPLDTPRQLINRLQRSADPLASLAGRTQNGGRLNIAAALAAPLNTPFNDDFAAAPVLTPARFNLRGSTSGATREASEPDHSDPTGTGSIWWKWTAPATGSIIADTLGSKIDTVLAVYSGTAVDALTLLAANDDAPAGGTSSELTFHAVAGVTYAFALAGKGAAAGLVTLNITSPPANDDFANAIVATGSPYRSTGANQGASLEPGEPLHAGIAGGRSVWWSWTAPASATYAISTAGSGFDTLLGVYTGVAPDGLVAVAGNDDANSGTTTSRAVLNATAGVTYHIAVDGKAGAFGGIVFEISTPPGNDDFADRLTFTGNVTGASNVGAGKEDLEPLHGGDTGGKSVWWTWTSPTNSVILLHTEGSDFDTLLGVYSGTEVTNLVTVAGDDDNGIGVSSLVTFLAHEGATYQFAVDGWGGDSGNIQLTLELVGGGGDPPGNDQFADRTALPSAPATATGSNLGATLEPGEPEHSIETLGGSSVWWSWTAPAGGTWRVTTAGSDFDTILAVYSGSGIASLVQLGSDDDEGPGLSSQIDFTAAAGTSYSFAVDGYDGEQGAITLAVSAINIPSTDGIPDSWWDERGVPPAERIAAGNPDGDAHTNLEEYLADTLPGSDASFLQAQIGRDNDGHPVLSVEPSSPRRTYRLVTHGTPAGLPSTWTPVGSAVFGNGSLLEFPPPPTPPTGAVYRIEVNVP
ncbi:MAG: S8 family peptidase [Kiritimatiellia bacterium]